MSWVAMAIGFSRRAAEDVGDDLDPFLDPPERLAQVDRDQTEEPDGEEREGDGRDREHRQQRRAAERQQGLAGQQLHWASAAASSTSLS